MRIASTGIRQLKDSRIRSVRRIDLLNEAHSVSRLRCIERVSDALDDQVGIFCLKVVPAAGRLTQRAVRRDVLQIDLHLLTQLFELQRHLFRESRIEPVLRAVAQDDDRLVT